MPPQPPVRGFLDVHYLLDSSEPRRPIPRIWFFLGGMIVVILFSGVLSTAAGDNAALVQVASSILVIGLMVALMTASSAIVKRVRGEQEAIETIGELVQMRRWNEAGGQLDQLLGRPMRTHGARAQSLVYLGAVLARYQRFDDALTVYDYLLRSNMLDAGSSYGIRLGRAMAMLRQDHLVDADRAISELRRQTPPGVDSAGLGLIELYRDVKTGHADDAVQRFEKSLPSLREQLGHRTGDAWALAARGYDLLGRADDAARAYRNATLLSPPVELFRRYPEVQKLEGRYEPAYAPAEAA